LASDQTVTQATLLSRVTLDYSPEEDRMKLTGLTQDGALVVTWLSLRLLGRVVPHLLTRYGAMASSLASKLQSSQLSHQSGAEDEAESPVLPASDTPAFLVAAADINQGADAIVLTLRDTATAIRFAIPAAKMAYWLSGLKSLYQTAEWPMNVWQGADQILIATDAVDSVTLH
jgi:hypothetical protein